MLKSKRIISMALTLVIVSTCSSGAYHNTVKALEETKQAKMSSTLLKEMDNVSKNEKVPVSIELANIDLDKVEKRVDSQTGMSMEELETLESNLLDSEELQNASKKELDEMLPGYFKETKKGREYVQSLVNERISAKRKISKQMYQENNAKRIKELGINKNELEFVSSYSPLIIGEMTESEIEDIVVQSEVKSIDFHDDVKIVPEESQINETETEVIATAASDYTTAWKSAISADITTDSLGIKGSGVTVGVLDKYAVDTSHSDLTDTDITVIGNAVNHGNNHGTYVTRVLAGYYGIVPKAKVYTASTNATSTTAEAEIEKLIDKDVPLINISLGFPRDDGDYYYFFEKWIDYISYQHNVLIVFSAGNVNEDENDYTVSGGALSYNTITVGGIDTKDTSDKSDDEFHTRTRYENGGVNGCAKPDCEAAYNDVLDYGANGTSAAAPAVTGVCAQIIQTKPTLAFQPDTVKAIILASCDRKCLESYTEGLTEKEGSGVVNAQRAIEIASSSRHARFPSTVGSTGFILGNGSDYRKCVLAWFVPATTVNNIEIPNYKFELGEMNGNNYIGTNLPNSSAEVIVTDAFKADLGSGYNYMRYYFSSVNGIKSTYLSLAWYDL